MNLPSTYACITLTSLVALAACGGGGGGGGNDDCRTCFTTFSELPRNGTTDLKGVAVTAPYTADQQGVVSVGNVAAPAASTAQIVTRREEAVAISVSAPGSNVSFDLREGDSVFAEDPVVAYESADGRRAALFVDPGAVEFEHQTFGAWLTGFNTGRGTVGVGSFGNRTPTASVPRNQIATYQGASTGFAVDNTGTPYVTVSAIDIETNFVNVQITSTNTTVVDMNTGADASAPILDFTGSGSVSGNGFTARVAGDLTAGTANGRFYGPQAQEAGGTFRTSGGGATYVGAFGAKR